MDQAISDRAKRAIWYIAIALAAIIVVAAAVALYERYGMNVQMASCVVVIALLAIASFYDLSSYVVPTWIVVVLLAMWVITVWFVPYVDQEGALGHAFAGAAGPGLTAMVLDGLVAGLIVGLGMLVLSIIVEARTGAVSLGGGDIKLLFVVSLYLGLPASLTMLLLACVIAAVFALVLSFVAPERIAGNRLDDPFLKMPIPFAPPIAIATTLSIVFGPFTLF